MMNLFLFSITLRPDQWGSRVASLGGYQYDEMMNNSNSETFCSVPWTQLATNASGNFRVCCNALPGKNLIRNSQGQALHITTTAVDEVWSAPTYEKIRRQLLDGERPEMCARCFREEDSGVESARQRWNQRWDVKREFLANAEMAPVRYIDLRLGNLCNLRCRMCNPYASDKWVDEWNEVVKTATLVPNETLSENEQLNLRKMDWPSDPDVWERLAPFLGQVEEIYLTGGEPFLSLEQVHLLNKLVNSGQSKNVILKYNTNLTSIPPRLLELWPKFKVVRINISIDEKGDLLNYIRFPADWQKIAGNLDRLRTLSNTLSNLELGVHVTVQMYNILGLENFVQLLQSRWQLTPYLNILNHPHCLNVRTLPAELKLKAVNNLSPLAEEIKSVQEIITYMMAEDWSEKYFPEFVQYTNRLDSLRNQNFLSLQPSFTEFWLRPKADSFAETLSKGP